MQDVHVGINFTNQMVGQQPTQPTGGWGNHIHTITLRQKTEGSSRPVGTWYGHAWTPTHLQTSATHSVDKGQAAPSQGDGSTREFYLSFVLFFIFRNTRDHFYHQKPICRLSVLVQAVGPLAGKRLKSYNQLLLFRLLTFCGSASAFTNLCPDAPTCSLKKGFHFPLRARRPWL